MNSNTVLRATVFLMLTTMIACTKEQTTIAAQQNNRTVRFEIYTDQNFSGDQHEITFSVFIKNNSKVYFDSALAPMKVSAIPGLANKIVIEKQIPNDNNKLAAGYIYAIENVGYSWHIDSIEAGTSFSTISYPFR